MRIYLHGMENTGWSIDADRRYAELFLTDIGHTITDNLFKADVVHSVWWSQLLEKRYYLLRFKRRIIATATNEIKLDNPDYVKAKKLVSLWVVPSKRQLDILKRDGVNAVYQPFYVDEKVFKRHDKSKEEIANLLGIGYGIIKDRFLIGSFQRDTLGSDLKSPKWQKGPELLIEILSSLSDKDKWLLVLAGPRRHFVISECERMGIPYLHCGQKPLHGQDDITINILDHERMALLYNLIDCYLVTSKSEGGPKAIPEASFCKTLIFSTNVGLAPDILDEHCLYDKPNDVARHLGRLIKKQDTAFFNKLITHNSANVNAVCSYGVMKERWKRIYEQL